MTVGQQIDDIFVLASAQLGQAKNGPYWRLHLQDRTGQIEGTIWSPASQAYEALEAGMFVRARGLVGTYRDKLQLGIDALTVLNGESDAVDLAWLVPTSETPPQDLLEAIEDLVTEHMDHKPWKTFCRKVLRDDSIRPRLLAATGAKSVHHAYVGGLLEHTLTVCRLCMDFCDHYPDLDRQTLLAAAIFHDLGKAWEYTGGVANEHTDEGRLLGHIYLGMEVLEPFLARAKALEDELKLHLRHIVLAHHGELEFGSPKRPKTPEAFALHYADNLDAKMNTVFGELDALGEDKRWTPYQRFLERFLYRPAETPGNKPKNEPPENQCLLPLKG